MVWFVVTAVHRRAYVTKSAICARLFVRRSTSSPTIAADIVWSDAVPVEDAEG